MRKLKIPLQTIEAAFENGDSSQRGLISNLWPEIFETNPYLKACKILGITPIAPLADRSDLDEVSADAYRRLIVCIRAKNMVDGEIWKPVYDGSENHYWNYFKQTPLGFSCTNTFYWFTTTSVGPRLEYRTYDLAREGAEEFKDLYNDFYIQ